MAYKPSGTVTLVFCEGQAECVSTVEDHDGQYPRYPTTGLLVMDVVPGDKLIWSRDP